MRRPHSRFRRGAPLMLLACSWSSRAHAQACCAGGSAVTPGRLEPHEDALVGAELRAAGVIGSYQLGGAFVASPPGTPEYDFEEDIFGAVRVLRHGQVALLVPVDETFRRTPADGAHFGGGIGDINLSGRYDFSSRASRATSRASRCSRASRFPPASPWAPRHSRPSVPSSGGRRNRWRWTRRASAPSRRASLWRSSRRSDRGSSTPPRLSPSGRIVIRPELSGRG